MTEKRTDAEYWIAIQENDTSKLDVLHATNNFVDRTLNKQHSYSGLRHAVQHGSLDAFRWLLDHGAAVRVDKFTETPNMMPVVMLEAIQAKRYGNEFVAALLAAGENPNLPFKSKLRAIHYATHVGADEIVTTLLRAGAHPDPRCRFGITPLATAAKYGFVSLTNTLVAAGGNVNNVNAYGRSVLDDAHPSVVSVLRGAGAKLSEELGVPADSFFVMNPLLMMLQEYEVAGGRHGGDERA
jgi:ankyrin repeat protein